MITVRITSTSGIADGELEFDSIEQAEAFAVSFFEVDEMSDLVEYAGRTYTLLAGITQVSIE